MVGKKNLDSNVDRFGVSIMEIAILHTVVWSHNNKNYAGNTKEH